MDNTQKIIIAISYFYHKNNVMNMEIFEDDYNAKVWLFSEFKKNNILTNWYDDQKNMCYYGFDEIYDNIKLLSLKEIIDGTITGGDINIIVKRYSIYL